MISDRNTPISAEDRRAEQNGQASVEKGKIPRETKPSKRFALLNTFVDETQQRVPDLVARVWFTRWRFAGPDGETYVSKRTVGECIGYGRGTVGNVDQILVDLGLLTPVGKPGRGWAKPSTYRLAATIAETESARELTSALGEKRTARKRKSVGQSTGALSGESARRAARERPSVDGRKQKEQKENAGPLGATPLQGSTNGDQPTEIDEYVSRASLALRLDSDARERLRASRARGEGGRMIPSHEILTSEEACAYLRLDLDDAPLASQGRTLQRLVREHGLRPVPGLRPYRFALDELRRWSASVDATGGRPPSEGREGRFSAESHTIPHNGS